jgi:hypothetical protein
MVNDRGLLFEKNMDVTITLIGKIVFFSESYGLYLLDTIFY